VTICTAQRRHFFGAVVDAAMQLSVPGGIVAEEWQRTADVRPYVTLGAWVVMPNHFHAIIAIHADEINEIAAIIAIGVARGFIGGRSSANSNRWRPNGSGRLGLPILAGSFCDRNLKTPTTRCGSCSCALCG
jgi:hypothetical protein